MNGCFNKLFFKQKNIYLIIFAILLFRVYQYCSMPQISAEMPVSSLDLYSKIQDIFVYTVFFGAIFCFWVAGGNDLTNDLKIVVRMKGRDRWAFSYAKFALFEAFTYALLLNVSCWLVILARGGNITENSFFFLWSLLFQILVLMVYAFLYFLIYLLTAKAYIGVIFLMLFGIIDYIFDRLDIKQASFSWGRALFTSQDYLQNPVKLFSNFVFLLCLVATVFVLCFIACNRVDLLAKTEEKDYE